MTSPKWERIARIKIGTICMALLTRKDDDLKTAVNDLIEWLRPQFERP